MTATFLIALDLDSTDLLLIAQDLQDAVEEKGFEVISVKPWSRATLPASPFAAPTLPTLPAVPGT